MTSGYKEGGEGRGRIFSRRGKDEVLYSYDRTAEPKNKKEGGKKSRLDQKNMQRRTGKAFAPKNWGTKKDGALEYREFP